MRKAVTPGLHLLLQIGLAAWLVTSVTTQAVSASTDPVGAFYAGKTVTIVVAYNPGGGYDLRGRLLARHLGRHIPGEPVVIVQNMPGAAGISAANHLYNVAPRNGTVIGIFGRGLPMEQLLGNPGVRFDALHFNWLGSMGEEVSVAIARSDSGIHRFDDLFTKALRVGGSGPGAETDVFPRLLNGVLGTKFELISGYQGGHEINLALERNEIQGRVASWTSIKSTRPDWLTQGFVKVLAQIGLRKHPDLAEVPLALDYARDEQSRTVLESVFARQAMAWPFVAPPGVPPERVAALRKAFMETVNDPDFLAEADRSQVEVVGPLSGDELQRLVRRLMATPPELVRQIDEYL